MYARSFYQDTETKVPENYDGNAFKEAESREILDTGEAIEEKAEQVSFFEPEVKTDKREVGTGGFLSSLGKLPFLSGIVGRGGIFPLPNISIPKIGSEEILIIAAAAYLFFSKDGDRECAIMLLLLLLIN